LRRTPIIFLILLLAGCSTQETTRTTEQKVEEPAAVAVIPEVFIDTTLTVVQSAEDTVLSAIALGSDSLATPADTVVSDADSSSTDENEIIALRLEEARQFYLSALSAQEER